MAEEEPEIIILDLPEEVKNLTWTIRKVSTIFKIAKVANSEHDKIFAKCPFTLGAAIGIPSKWQLCIKYMTDRANDTAEIYLEYLGSKCDIRNTSIPINAKFSGYINNVTGVGALYELDSPVLPYNADENGRNPAGVLTIYSPSNFKYYSYIGERDELTFHLQITMYGMTKEKVISRSNGLEIARVGQSWQGKLNENFCKDFAKLLEIGDGSDVTIKVLKQGDEKPSFEKKAHKLILSARSSVFATMFQSGLKESSSGEVVIEDLTPEVVDLLLKFIYTGTLDSIWGSFVDELIYAADKYQLTVLQQFLDENIEMALTPKNVMQVRKLAKLHKLTEALLVANNYLKQNLATVLEQE